MPREATAPRDFDRNQASPAAAEATQAENQAESNESGQTMAEYALITALIAVVVAGAITSVGNPAIQALYTKLGDAIP